VALGGPSPVGPASAVVLTHDFPSEPDGARRTGRSLPVLADRLAGESGWRVVAGCLRGVGASEGDFSLCGWLQDMTALVDHAARLAAGGRVWVVGFGVTAGVALCLAATDDRVRGVGCMAGPATFSDWAQDPRAMLDAARRLGVVSTDGFPRDVAAWAGEFTTLRPEEAVVKVAPRAVLLVHGADDDEVPVADARLLADAAGPAAELHVLAGAGHRLRADPRAMALLVGWLERQGP
ncbi:MAG TPA: alpha/beta hydrolase, partial [Acidimicrobiales bacterium]|nr:alpha/beta hydrolase [Acidimicrobiales bacterium]